MNLPNKKYDIIYADPPWCYNDKAKSGNRGANFKYDLMNTGEIADLPIEQISNRDSFLFMWATFPLLADALNVISAWGFKYKTCAFTWVKKTRSDTWFTGMGNWTRANAEICLLGTRGRPKRQSASVKQVIESVPQEHSKKPDIVRERIVELCGNRPRIELFARRETSGWDSWGLEVGK